MQFFSTMFSVLAISFSIWIAIYLLIGWLLAKDMTPGLRLLFTFGWLVLPMVEQALHEEPEFNGVEGFCTCKRRDWRDAGGSYCSFCGGKIKDKLWKRS